jgi:hypothetical protein
MVELTPALRAKYASLEMLLIELKNRLSDALRPTLDGAVPEEAKTESDGAGDGVRRTGYRHPAVVKVSVVQGVPFFGYHNDYRPFIRISLCNPALMNRAATVLLSGGVMGVKLQPCEAHIPYLLQVSSHVRVTRAAHRPYVVVHSLALISTCLAWITCVRHEFT